MQENKNLTFKQIIEENNKLHEMYKSVNQKYLDSLKSNSSDKNTLKRQVEELKTKYEKSSEQMLNWMKNDTAKSKKEINSIVNRTNDKITASQKNLKMLKDAADLEVKKGKLQNLLEIILIIINNENKEIIKEKFNKKLQEISPLVNVADEKWFLNYVHQVNKLITFENYDRIFTMFKNTLLECEELVRSESSKNAEYKALLLDYMINITDWKYNVLLKQRLNNIFEKYHIQNESGEERDIWKLFYDLYIKITEENYKDILSRLSGVI